MKLNKREILRKSWHISWGIIFFYILKSFGILTFRYFLGTLLFIGIIVTILDKKKIKIEFINYLLKKLARKDEKIQASFLFILGIFIVSLIFNQRVINTSIFVLSFSDGLATIIGVHCKRKLWKKKTIGGTTTFFLTTFVIISYFYNPLIGFISSIILTPIELYTTIDDNIVIPIACSITVLILALFV